MGFSHARWRRRQATAEDLQGELIFRGASVKMTNHSDPSNRVVRFCFRERVICLFIVLDGRNLNGSNA